MKCIKPYIKPIIIHLTDDNYRLERNHALNEIDAYDVYRVGRENISTVPACLDTETTTVTETKTGNQYAFIWVYQIQIGQYCYIIRKRDILLKLLRDINNLLDDLKRTMYLGIANTKYEWSFLSVSFYQRFLVQTGILFGQSEPLAPKAGRVMICDINRMANSSLEKIGKDYCTTQKKKGDLDYTRQRNSFTPITDKELGYIVNDVVVGAEYLTFIHNRYTVHNKKIPLTSTGFIRQIIKDEAYKVDETGEFVYKDILDETHDGFPISYTEYEKIMNWLFRGGYTHGNEYYYCAVVEDVEHIDYTSHYPTMALQHKFPLSFSDRVIKWGKYKITVSKYKSEFGLNQLLQYQSDIAFYTECTFYNIEARNYHSLESTSKTIDYERSGAVVDNGRIRNTARLRVMLTEQDYHIYKRMYKWDKVEVHDLHVGIKKPVPPFIANAIIQSYSEKKRLKDSGSPYAVEKAILNACYGCTVERIPIEGSREVYENGVLKYIKTPVNPDYLVLGDKNMRNWSFFGYVCDRLEKQVKTADREEIENDVAVMYSALYNGVDIDLKNDKTRTIYDAVKHVLQQRAYREAVNGHYSNNGHKLYRCVSPFIGIWITAYARRRLIDMICDLEEFGIINGYEPIVIYYDTDSLFLNCHQDVECWAKVKEIIDKYNADCRAWNIDNLPESMDDIGLFTWEPTATHFKQLGAKRYLQRYRVCKKYHYRIKSHELKQGKPSFKSMRKAYICNRFVIESTIAGLNKKMFNVKINRECKTVDEAFDFFTNGMIFNAEETGKLIPQYTTKPYCATITDDYGNTEKMYEDCGQVLVSVPFEMYLVGSVLAAEQRRIG